MYHNPIKEIIVWWHRPWVNHKTQESIQHSFLNKQRIFKYNFRAISIILIAKIKQRVGISRGILGDIWEAGISRFSYLEN